MVPYVTEKKIIQLDTKSNSIVEEKFVFYGLIAKFYDICKPSGIWFYEISV